MKRKTRIRTALLALALTAVLAGSALASTPKATLTIRHQTRGCHTWSINNTSYRASLKVRLAFASLPFELGNWMSRKTVSSAIAAVVERMTATRTGITFFTLLPSERYYL